MAEGKLDGYFDLVFYKPDKHGTVDVRVYLQNAPDLLLCNLSQDGEQELEGWIQQLFSNGTVLIVMNVTYLEDN